jgi:hypothetical protein
MARRSRNKTRNPLNPTTWPGGGAAGMTFIDPVGATQATLDANRGVFKPVHSSATDALGLRRGGGEFVGLDPEFLSDMGVSSALIESPEAAPYLRKPSTTPAELMPIADEETLKLARRRRAAMEANRRGRMSTFLTPRGATT